MKTLKAVSLILFLVAMTTLGFSQSTLTQTTLTAAVTGGTNAQNFVALTAVTSMAAPSAAAGVQTVLYIDGELMTVITVNSTSLVATVQRGQNGTKATPHANGATVWYGQPSLFAAATGPINPASSGRYRYFTAAAVQASLTGLGNSTADTAGGVFCGDINVTGRTVFISTGAGILNGATVGTDLNLVALYDYSGTLLGTSATAGAVTSGASAFQQRAWITPLVLGSGQYFLCYQTNGTTDNFQTIKTATWVDVVANSYTGTFGTLPNPLTVPVSFSANKAPFGYIY